MQLIEAKQIETQSHIAIVVSRFTAEITEGLLHGTLERLQELEVPKDNITIAHVPGAIEIPLTAQTLAKTQEFDAIIALGAVVRGETDHYDYVCEQASHGCQRVMLEENIPVVFGILTTDNLDQARDRLGGKRGHKGRDAADVAMEMISVLKQI
jgi:6,7-dimethyl-8-ribityllumazine synthase